MYNWMKLLVLALTCLVASSAMAGGGPDKDREWTIVLGELGRDGVISERSATDDHPEVELDLRNKVYTIFYAGAIGDVFEGDYDNTLAEIRRRLGMTGNNPPEVMKIFETRLVCATVRYVEDLNSLGPRLVVDLVMDNGNEKFEAHLDRMWVDGNLYPVALGDKTVYIQFRSRR